MSSKPEMRKKRTTKRVVKPKKAQAVSKQSQDDSLDSLYMRFFENLMDSKHSLFSARGWDTPNAEDQKKVSAHRHNARELLTTAIKLQVSLLRLLSEEDKTDTHLEEALRYIFNISVKLGATLGKSK